MNQALSRRLRMRCLLLLAPLLVAGTPAPLPVTRALVLLAAPTHLVFLPLPEEIAKGQCVPVTVEARDGSGTPAPPGSPLLLRLTSSLLGGAFFSSGTCQSTISSVVLPGDAERVQVWFKATTLGLVALTASDGLLGLADALSVPISVVLNPTARLVFLNVPSSATAGQPVNITVEARDSLGFVATGYSGTIEFTSTDVNAVLPGRYTLTPATDRGRKTFPITFQSGGTWELVAQDVSNSTLRAHAPNIPVRASEAVLLEIVELAQDTFPGRPMSFKVLALDANGNPGSLSGELIFSSDDPQAELPSNGPLQPSYTVTFNEPGTKTLTVTAPSTGTILTAAASVMVNNATPRDVELTPSADRLPTCEAVTLTLRAVDGSTEPVSVSLCRPRDRAATAIAANDFISSITTEQCVSGTFVSSATVVWENKVGEEVQFTLYGAESTDVTVRWVPELEPELSSFLFRDTSEDLPKLPVSTGERTLQLNLSDTCPQPLALPPDKLSFSATPPLSISTSYDSDTPGQWVVSVKLPECPEDPTTSLAIWPTINGTELLEPGGGRLERHVQPWCPPEVALSIHSPDDGAEVEPGGLVELEVELSNKGPQPILNGILMVAVEGLTLIEAHLEGEPLTAAEVGGFVIPELLPGKTVKVKVKAQATTNLEQLMSAKVWYVDADGAELTPQQAVDLSLGRLGVNVGCGCHAASLPGQLLPWLALLLAASRPWDRSRRLRRGERIDR